MALAEPWSGRVELLLLRVFEQPLAVIVEVDRLLIDAAPLERCALLRVKGNAFRELRRMDESLALLEESQHLAAAFRETTLEGEALMSLAATLSYVGDFDRAIALTARSIELLEGDGRVKAMSQHAGVLRRAGRYADAEVAFARAEEAAAGSADPTIIGDVWMNRGVMYGWAGEIEDAERDTQRALDLFESLGWAKRAVDMQHNLAWLAGRRGDLVEAFRRFDVAEVRYRSIGMTGASIFPDRCEALIAAGLVDEALALAERSVVGLDSQGDDVDLAEALMLAARAALLVGDNELAAREGVRATARFKAQSRQGWWAAAATLTVLARLRAGGLTPDDHQLMADVVESTQRAGLRAATGEATVLCIELAIETGQLTDAIRQLAALDRRDLGVDTRCRFDLATARILAACGRPGEALDVCHRAVDEFGAATSELGGSDLRASVVLHTTDLVAFALSVAQQSGGPEDVLTWAERQRASALDLPPVQPPDDPELTRLLTLLRLAVTDLDAKRRDGVAAVEVGRRCDQLREDAQRRARHVRRGRTPPAIARPLVEASEEAQATWVTYVESAGKLIAVIVEAGKPRVVDLGDAKAIRLEATLFRSTLSMYLVALGRGVVRESSGLLVGAARVDELLLRPLGLAGERVVISPTKAVHEVAWGLLPSLRSTPHCLAPSIGVWRRCRQTPTVAPTSVTVVAGPELALAEREAMVIASRYSRSTLLTGADATVAQVMTSIRGIDLAHIVCHGHFSSYNPMFSSLLMADGPMFVHDVERLGQPPTTAILSACNAGNHTTPAGQEILGMTASLLASGMRWVIAATAPIPDTLRTVDVMDILHASLAAGAGAAEALRIARSAHPIVGGAFSCYGAGE